MKFYGVNVAEGSNITNAVLPSGSSFPANPNIGELFYKTGAAPGLYVYGGASWQLTASTNTYNGYFLENAIVIDTNQVITSGMNAGSFGPLEIADGVEITIPDGSNWSIV